MKQAVSRRMKFDPSLPQNEHGLRIERRPFGFNLSRLLQVAARVHGDAAGALFFFSSLALRVPMALELQSLRCRNVGLHGGRIAVIHVRLATIIRFR